MKEVPIYLKISVQGVPVFNWELFATDYLYCLEAELEVSISS